MIDRDFAEHLLKCFDDPQAYGVHQLFNVWWQYAPGAVQAKYLADFRADPAQRAWVEQGWYADPLDLAALLQMPEASLGRHYGRFITENGLEAKIATNYRDFHRMLRATGVLKNIPAECEYVVLRGFQTHDFLHVLTGYRATPRDEIALQAFCLAQIRFPYFGMWVSNVTTRMTFLDPDMIVGTMDAVSEGWHYGRQAANIQFLRFEDLLDQPIAELRARHGLTPVQPQQLRAAA